MIFSLYSTIRTEGERYVEKLCGSCSIEQGLSKEERIALALSRVPNEVYACPSCGIQHAFRSERKERIKLDEIPKKPAKKTKKKKKTSNMEQMELF